VLKIDAAASRLVVLKFITCYFWEVQLVCLPRLARLVYDTWLQFGLPLQFGHVPRLHEIRVATCTLLVDEFFSSRALPFVESAEYFPAVRKLYVQN
jgi:hypothetical protein